MSIIDRIRTHFCERDTGLLVKYLGLETGLPCSLRQAGHDDHLTAERVRQIIVDIRQTLPFIEFPEISKTAILFEHGVPFFCGQQSRSIEKESGLPDEATFLRFAHFTGQKIPFEVYELKGFSRKIIISEYQLMIFSVYYDLFHSMASRSGGVFMGRLHDAAEAVGRHSTLDGVSYFARCLSRLGFPVIDVKTPEGLWLGLPVKMTLPGRRILRLLDALPVLAITDRVMEKVIHAGIDIQDRIPATIFPDWIGSAGVTMDQNVVRLKAGEAIMGAKSSSMPIDSHKRESSTEKGLDATLVRMIALLRRAGGRMSKKAFFDCCTAQGIALATARVYGYNSGIFRIEEEDITIPLQ